MLAELTIRNFAVIRDTTIKFSPGMNALTGETGAGKSIVLDALSAVLGARMSADFVRTGESSAFIEAVFEISPEQEGELHTLLSGFGVEVIDCEPLILSRDISANGRSTARVNGRTLTATAQSQIGEHLVDIHGQSDHLSLLRPRAQLDLLDAYAGTLNLRGEFAMAYTSWRERKRQLEEFDAEQRNRAQRLDILRFQSEEIVNADIQRGEEEELRIQRSVLLNAEKLSSAAGDAYQLLAGDETDSDQPPGVLDGLRIAESRLAEAEAIDPELTAMLQGVREALYNLEEQSGELRNYSENIQFSRSQLETIEDRLDTIRSLTGKYGPTIDDLFNYLENIEAELYELETQTIDIEHLAEQERVLAASVADLAVLLSEKRQRAASTFASEVVAAIAELNMGSAEFEIRFSSVELVDGIEIDGSRVSVNETGTDQVQYFLAANRGEELRPLGSVASGGETARLMLALKSILSQADRTPTLVFDEIDVGVGARSGQVVGEKLWNLATDHQVIVISHLPQVAAFASQHISMIKAEEHGRTETSAVLLTGDESIDEIATMFDGKPVSPESRANAEALLARVARWKQQPVRT